MKRIIKTIKKIKLSSEEKKSLETYIRDHIKSNPIIPNNGAFLKKEKTTILDMVKKRIKKIIASFFS